MATWPWVAFHANLGQPLDDFPNMKRWFDTMRAGKRWRGATR